MRRFCLIVALCCTATMLHAASLSEALSGQLQAAITANEKLADHVKQYVIKTLLPMSADDALVAAVIAQNAKGVSLDTIKEIDEAWKAAEEEIPAMLAAMEGPAAERLFAFSDEHPEIVEVFLMDNQGAVVAESALTSDYWQGDEAKWQGSFNGGAGGVDVGDEELDESTDQVIQQVSLPIEHDGKIIGAITWGINVSSLKQ